MKNKRIATKQEMLGKTWIELDERGVFFWKGESSIPNTTQYSFSFPATIEFVEDFFAECGRVFDKSKLPPHLDNPYLSMELV